MSIKVLIVNDYDELSKRIADIIASVIRGKPNSVLGLVTGGIPPWDASLGYDY